MALTRRFALIGAGPHARAAHLPALRRLAGSEAEIALLVDLEDQRPRIEAALEATGLRPKEVVYLPAGCRDGATLHPTARTALERAKDSGLAGVVISTEPRSHLVYTRWALEHGIDVLLDKPLSARVLIDRDPTEAAGLVADYFELRDIARRTGARCLVNTPRRHHEGYRLVRETIAEVVQATGVPLTYLHVYHCDGMWNMPDEYFTRENHPYKYGYGKLMHSGYHQIDLTMWLLEAGEPDRETRPDRLELSVRGQGPADLLSQTGHEFYRRVFGPSGRVAAAYDDAARDELTRHGETDVHVLGQLTRSGRVRTTVSLDLMQTGFSRRAWADLPADTYHGNGRVRHEQLTAHVGHLLTVHVNSYQTGARSPQEARHSGVGAEDHFDVTVFRNADVIGGEVMAQHRLATDGGSHHQRARDRIWTAFLGDRETDCLLEAAELPTKVTAAVSYAMRRRGAGDVDGSPAIRLSAGSTQWLEADGGVVD